MTEQQRTEKLVVDLDHVRQNNIVFVDLSKPLTENVFSLEYEKAARVITRILDENEEDTAQENYHCRECKTRASRSCESCKFRSYTGCREGNYGKHRSEYQTAVPFIGDRGTGKTSVMLSVLNRLQNYSGQIEDAPFNLGKKHDSVKFITFDMIDANTLSRNDDVMEIILARMLSYLDELQPDHDFRDLYRQIDELSSAMCKLRGDQREAAVACGLMGLQKVVDRQSAIDGFQKLVEDFLKAMSAYKYNCRKCYLVIALDDIDMYQGSTCGMYTGQFALLEQVYNHMRIPGLIVLMTYNEHILRRTCNRHFNRIYFGESIARKYTPTEQNDIDTLTGQFMSKLFPQEQRIYLPNYMLIDSANRSNLFVRPEITEKGVRKPVAPFGINEAIPVKEFMLRLIAHKTGVFFDAAGTKMHFFEPRNLRNLGELFEVIYSMQEVEEDRENCEAIRGINRQMLLRYMYNQFALRRLSPEEQDRFRKLSALPITRQHRTLVDWIREERVRLADESFGYLARTEKYRWRYSYGELLHNIYFATRIGTTAGYGEAFLSKAFMHCIFGSHSVILNNIIRSEGANKDLLEIIGSSVSGRWANEMLPKFYVEDFTQPAQAGSVSLPIRCYFGWAVPENVKTAILHLGKDRKSEECLQEFFEALFFAGMFFTGHPTNGLGIYLDADLDEDDCAVLCLKSETEDHICFNVMNFVINTYRALPGLADNKAGFLSNLEKRKNTVVEDISDSGYLQYMYQKLRKLGQDVAYGLSYDWSAAEANAEFLLEKMENRKSRRYGQDPRVQSNRIRATEDVARTVRRARAWKQLIYADKEYADKESNLKDLEEFNGDAFIKCWNRVLSKTTKYLFEKFWMWEENHKQNKLVLPVENFDMMYNIVKRLASVYYHDIPEEAYVEEVYDSYVHLYKSVLKELELQDRVYFADTPENSFAKLFRDSVFYQEVVEVDGKRQHTEMLREIVTNMIRSTIIAQNARRNAKAFEFPL